MRYEAKRPIVWAMFALVWPLGLPARLEYRIRGTEHWFEFGGRSLSLIPGKPGQYLRTAFYMMTLAGCHYDLAMAFGSFFTRPAAKVGRNVVIGSYAIIGNAEIEEGVLIGSRVSVLSGKHQHGRWLDKTAVVQEPVYARVRIGAGSWIGDSAVVMDSVGKGCRVSAGSVVTRSAPDGSVAVGNPARFLLPGTPD